MAGKIHNGSNGPGPCSAKPGGRGCPFDPEGTGENHFETQAEAQTAYDAKMESEHGTVPKVSQSSASKNANRNAVKESKETTESVVTLTAALAKGDSESLTKAGKHKEVLKVPHKAWKKLQSNFEVEANKKQTELNELLKQSAENLYVDGNSYVIGALQTHETPEGIRKSAREEADRRSQNRLISPSASEEMRHKKENLADVAEQLIKANPNIDPVKKYRDFEKKVHSKNRELKAAKIKAKFAKSGAELTDNNRAVEGIKVPLGYDKQRAAYALDGRMLGIDNSSHVGGPSYNLDGKTIKIRPSQTRDPGERVERNAAKGFKLGYMLTPSSINDRGEITPVAQTKGIRDKNIPIAEERTL